MARMKQAAETDTPRGQALSERSLFVVGQFPEETARRLAEAKDGDTAGLGDRGALWTYLTTDQPFGVWTKRFLSGLRRKLTA